MPCNDDGRIPLADAALCAIMWVLVDEGLVGSVLAKADWQKAGVTMDELYRWWTEHKLSDQTAKRIW